MRVATANVQCDLDNAAARRCLDAVLATSPDIVLLQEWALNRLNVLRPSGSVSVIAPVALGEFGDGLYQWFSPITGGCAIGLASARFEHPSARLRSLSLPGLVDGDQKLQPGRTAVEVIATDQTTGQQVSAVSYHLVPVGQANHDYAPREPIRVARHRSERKRLQRVVDRAVQRGPVYVGGDSNLDGFTIRGLSSTWAGPGGIDDVFALRAPISVRRITTESDHRAVVVDYD